MNKSINSLYRKYRPTKFSDVVEQSHVVKTIENQIKNNKLNHAYLFCGTRGTGKTTVAKIFANAVAKLLDIFEIDAASNNSVDNVRDLIEKVKFPPIESSYKVYIIDEVHMFSGSAFNAFLKTLEEPPSHVIFILCTTEPHKLPQTIQSRVLRFDFRPVSLTSIEKHIEKILKKENVEATKESIKQIAKAGRGSVRDCLSILEATLAYKSDKFDEQDVVQILGTVSHEKLNELGKAVIEKNINQTKKHLESIFTKGVNVNALVRDFLYVLKEMYIESNNRDRIREVYKSVAEIELLIKYSQDPVSMFESVCLLA
ncbi:MAG: DNA polymerase III subunit gamma/tau [Firmicutes bacterium]|nr:DNA polymerase III subunit gamma/tau [Bacillota bacterium]